MKGQPLTYNKDNQEDKEPLFDTVDTLRDTLRIMAEMVGGAVDPATGARSGGLIVKAEAMERAALRGYATATDLADYLVKKGLAFRDAHEVVAHAVKVALGHGHAAGFRCPHRRGRVRGAHAARLDERTRRHRWHCAFAGAGADRAPSRAAGRLSGPGRRP
jgi:hypothetical protein